MEFNNKLLSLNKDLTIHSISKEFNKFLKMLINMSIIQRIYPKTMPNSNSNRLLETLSPLIITFLQILIIVVLISLINLIIFKDSKMNQIDHLIQIIKHIHYYLSNQTTLKLTLILTSNHKIIILHLLFNNNNNHQVQVAINHLII